MKRVPQFPGGIAVVRIWRAAAVVALAWMVWSQSRWMASHRPVTEVGLEEVRRIFPEAAALVAGADGVVEVRDGAGRAAGVVVRTSPLADGIRGYSGPNDILIGLDGEGRVQGLHLRRSGDTPDHVALVMADGKFAAQFRGWVPGSGVEMVSGATLTSAAMAEAVQARLAGGAPSLRFPEEVRLEEVRGFLPGAAALRAEGGRLRVLDAAGGLLGYAVRTSPAADNVAGFRGPTEALAVLSPEEKVLGVGLRKSYDTVSYVEQIREDEWFLAGFKGRTAADIARMDFSREGIEGVSGATQTSWALAEGLKRRLAMPVMPAAQAGWRPRGRDWLTGAVVAGGLLMAFSRLRGVRWLRVGWQALVMGWALWTGGDLVSLALLGGWAQHGVAWQAAPGAALMAAVALVVPWAARRQVYCHQLCPHGAAQEWLGRLRRKKAAVPAKADGWLRGVPWLLLTVGLGMLLLNAGDVNLLEPFDAWVLRVAAVVPLAIAVVGLVASLFVPQAYCRYGCPTGALLSFVRSTGRNDCFGRKDAVVLGLLVLSAAALPLARMRAAVAAPAGAQGVVLRGAAMGSTWEVKLRGFSGDAAALERACAAELEAIEGELSLWRADSAVSKFNAAQSTVPQVLPAAALLLVKAAGEVSAATDGAFDITAGPLVKLWGFGPPPRATGWPGEGEIEEARKHTGWQRLTLDAGALAKADPHTGIDLTALTEGYAADRLAALLAAAGAGEFLINVSGELRARGPWAVAIEHPARTLSLADAALATSGTYRQQREVDGRRATHLIDARTGHPVTHRTVSVSVRHASAMMADVWATALNVLGSDAGLPLAERLGLAAEFTDGDDRGQFTLRATAVWKGGTW